MPRDGGEPAPVPTLCETCAHVFRGDRRDPPWRWMCMKHKRLEGFGFVTRSTWDEFPPYLYCRDVNGGLCPLYAPAPPAAGAAPARTRMKETAA